MNYKTAQRNYVVVFPTLKVNCKKQIAALICNSVIADIL